MKTIEDFVSGDGPVIETGYRRGDSWRQINGTHVECTGRIVAIGAGLGRDRNGKMGEGVLVRCSGCFGSWVIR